jgi:hypothetical protein
MMILLARIFTLLQFLESKLAHYNCLDFEIFMNFKNKYQIDEHLRVFPPLRATHTSIEFECDSIFQMKNEESCIAESYTLDDLTHMDPQYIIDLSMNGTIVVSKYHIRDPACSKTVPTIWPKSDIDELKKKSCTCGQYNNNNCEIAFQKYQKHIQGKRGMVIGSYHFWAEAAALRFGARHVTTIEYSSIYTNHRKLTIYTPSEYSKLFLNASKREKTIVDFIISYSSLEHDGLGRYGDPLNAHGDLQSIAKAFCLLRPGGVLFLGVPLGRDEVQFNAHRIYGYRRLSVILSMGFELVDIVSEKPFTINVYNGDSTQPVIVLQKPLLHLLQKTDGAEAL